MKRAGFTGTSKTTPTVNQALALKSVLRDLFDDGYTILEHGEAANADTLANNMAKAIGYRTVGHPSAWHANRVDVDDEFPPAPPLSRNKTIVSRTDILIAMPRDEEALGRAGGGTWATVRYARTRSKPIIIIWSNGVITREQST